VGIETVESRSTLLRVAPKDVEFQLAVSEDVFDGTDLRGARYRQTGSFAQRADQAGSG
jgi:hypothetical protein